MRNDNWIKEDRPESWEQSFYRTGSTRPPKSHRGLLAAMLVTIIFFCGIFTAFRLLNIRLFQSIPMGIDTTKLGDSVNGDSVGCIGFTLPNTTAKESAEQSLAQGYAAGRPWLGVSVKQLSSFDQSYYRLPSGLYITKVAPATDADAKGLMAGDILLSIDGTKLTDSEALQQLLYSHSAGDTVSVAIYRNGKQLRMKLTLSEVK